MRTPITHISFRALIPLLLFFTLVINAPGLSAAPAGSTYPVQVTPMLIPPYSLYLSDYFSGTTERLSLTLTNRDLQQPQVRVKLRLSIACASGLTLTTHPQAVFDPIVLDAGVPTRLTMQELAPYFLPARLLTQGYMQGGKLTEGNVEFGFEVLEYNTGKILSQKNIAFGNIISPKPPKLNLPINNDIVTVNEPQQLTFQWSPQYFSTGNVEYEFVIKELMDKTASPQEAFLYSREVYRTTTTASAINYTMGEPTLEGNKRYAWCVHAVMHDGVETVNRFENDGYSPVSVFDMRYDCRPPMDVQATTERGTIMLRWLPQPHHLKYVVSYRRTDFDANTWYTKTTTSTLINLSDITPGQNYTYRVGAYCDDNTPVYSAPGTISVPAEDTEFLANCGKDPQIKITNRKPKDRLNVNDIIMAGDFPVTLTRVSGSNGTFTGEGWVRIPYLFANFGVRFSGIGVNEENRLISGQIETKYDKTESGVANLDVLDQGGTDADAIINPDLFVAWGEQIENTFGSQTEPITPTISDSTVVESNTNSTAIADNTSANVTNTTGSPVSQATSTTSTTTGANNTVNTTNNNTNIPTSNNTETDISKSDSIKTFALTQLTAIDFSAKSRVAHSGETLYYINKPITKEHKKTSFSITYSPDIPIKEIAKDKINWKLDEVTYPDATGTKGFIANIDDAKNHAVSVIGGYPTVETKNVKVEWVDEDYNKTKITIGTSSIPFLKKMFDLSNSMSNVSNTLDKIPFFKRIKKNEHADDRIGFYCDIVPFEQVLRNEEDTKSRLYYRNRTITGGFEVGLEGSVKQTIWGLPIDKIPVVGTKLKDYISCGVYVTGTAQVGGELKGELIQQKFVNSEQWKEITSRVNPAILKLYAEFGVGAELKILNQNDYLNFSADANGKVKSEILSIGWIQNAFQIQPIPNGVNLDFEVTLSGSFLGKKLEMSPYYQRIELIKPLNSKE